MLYNWLKEITFAFPLALALFIVLPLLVWWYVKRSDRSQGAFRVSSAHAFTVTTWKNRFRHLPFILRLLALALLILALARPQKGHEEEHSQGEGIDIVLCMDVSGSMGSRDMLPSRMEVAKQVAEDFVRGRPVDRIGLVIFSGESFTQCPVTTDRNTLIMQIRTLESRRYLKDGTVIGEGLATAVDRLSESEGKSKVVILITDGKEDPPETRLIDPLTALEIARSRNVRVHTIGMGAVATNIVEVTGNEPAPRNPAIDFIDEDLLRRIANETGGKYFRARDKDALRLIYNQIDKLETSLIEVTNYKRYEEKFLPFVLVALGLLLLEIGMRFTVFRRYP